MGACGSKGSRDDDILTGNGGDPHDSLKLKGKNVVERIGNALKAKRRPKIILLGPGDAGKSTVFKQLRFLGQTGDRDQHFVQESAYYRSVIHHNIFKSMKKVIDAQVSEYRGDSTYKVRKQTGSIPSAIMPIAQRIQNSTPLPDFDQWVAGSQTLDSSLADDFQKLWDLKPVKLTLELEADLQHRQLEEQLSYFMEHFERIRAADYIPTADDILHARIRTEGSREVEIPFKAFGGKGALAKEMVRVVDLGGQVKERQGWTRHFEDVVCVMFIVAVNDWDKTMLEDMNRRRIDDAVDLFSSVCKSPFFGQCPIMLLMNKVDLFYSKIEHVDFRKTFNEFAGCEDSTVETVNMALNFLSRRFEGALQRARELDGTSSGACNVYPHALSAVDPANMEFVLDSALSSSLSTKASNEVSKSSLIKAAEKYQDASDGSAVATSYRSSSATEADIIIYGHRLQQPRKTIAQR